MLLLKSSEIDGVYFFHCPGCGNSHWFSVSGRTPAHPNEIDEKLKWQFNSNMEKPTVKASILVKTPKNNVCHSIITDGKIEYLNDCTHELAGKIVDMVDYDLD